MGLFGGGSGRTLVLEAGEALAAGAPVAMDFGPSKTDGQLLVDHGVLDPLISQASSTVRGRQRDREEMSRVGPGAWVEREPGGVEGRSPPNWLPKASRVGRCAGACVAALRVE